MNPISFSPVNFGRRARRTPVPVAPAAGTTLPPEQERLQAKQTLHHRTADVQRDESKLRKLQGHIGRVQAGLERLVSRQAAAQQGLRDAQRSRQALDRREQLAQRAMGTGTSSATSRLVGYAAQHDDQVHSARVQLDSTATAAQQRLDRLDPRTAALVERLDRLSGHEHRLLTRLNDNRLHREAAIDGRIETLAPRRAADIIRDAHTTLTRPGTDRTERVIAARELTEMQRKLQMAVRGVVPRDDRDGNPIPLSIGEHALIQMEPQARRILRDAGNRDQLAAGLPILFADRLLQLGQDLQTPGAEALEAARQKLTKRNRNLPPAVRLATIPDAAVEQFAREEAARQHNKLYQKLSDNVTRGDGELIRGVETHFTPLMASGETPTAYLARINGLALGVLTPPSTP